MAGGTPKPPKSFGANAAQLSWQLPLVVIPVMFVLPVLMGPQAPRAAFGMLNVLAAVVGFGAAVVALLSISRFGTRGIVIPACVGLLLNAALIGLFIFLVLFTAQRARSRRVQVDRPPMESAVQFQAAVG